MTSSLRNGCGPKGIWGKFIPDGLLGVSINEACNVHDDQYSSGRTKEDRRLADQGFLDNMLHEVGSRQGIKVLKLARKALAYTYYFSVRVFGGFFFGKQAFSVMKKNK